MRALSSFLPPLLFLSIQGAIFLFVPSVSAAVAYGAMVAAPLCAAAATGWRARSERGPARAGWLLLALALAVWAAGAFGNLWQELVLGRLNEMYRDSMLAFSLSAVPIAFLLATDWRAPGRPLVRWIDATLALALVYGFFLYIWSTLTARGEPDDIGVHAMVWLLDAQNLCLAIGAVVRWRAADANDERALFGSLTVYVLLYAALLFANNHWLAGDPSFGPEHASVITVVFAALWGLALHRPAARAAREPRNPALVRVVRTASPLVLAAALLAVSLFLIRTDYAAGAVGVLIAVLGYSVRNTLSQVRSIERGDLLMRERTRLQNIAWTDALTGLANRHALDAALGLAGRQGAALGRPLAVLMIDIDHFKLFNDRHGHPEGDACLRRVAQALQDALARPSDVLARYGGEEFIAVLHDSEVDGASVVAERLRAEIEALQLPHGGSPLGIVTVSIGVAATLPRDLSQAQGLIDQADKALYAAKAGGRNRVEAAPGTAGPVTEATEPPAARPA